MKYSDLTEAVENVKRAIEAIESQDLNLAKYWMMDVLETLEGEKALF